MTGASYKCFRYLSTLPYGICSNEIKSSMSIKSHSHEIISKCSTLLCGPNRYKSSKRIPKLDYPRLLMSGLSSRPIFSAYSQLVITRSHHSQVSSIPIFTMWEIQFYLRNVIHSRDKIFFIEYNSKIIVGS